MGDSAISRIDNTLAGDEFAWSVTLVGEDQSDKLATLAQYLDDGHSTSGDGKRVPSGYAYWGIGPTIAWFNASNDPTYMVIKVGTEMFRRQWRSISPLVTDEAVHLVSLGVGTGAKDGMFLETMHQANPSMLYVPIDMSAEMLRTGSRTAVREAHFPLDRVLGLQIDLSLDGNLEELKQFLDRLVGDESILYSLVGNTVANFDDDAEFLGGIARVLRPQDRILVEFATTENLTQDAVRAAEAEYRQTRGFVEFVASAVRYNTDLKIDLDQVRFAGSVEDESILLKVFWQNVGGEDIRMLIPGSRPVHLKPLDTIRLYTTRKYTTERIDQLVDGAGLRTAHMQRERFRHTQRQNPFGLELRLMARDENAPTELPTFDVWK
ncbi:putative SAM-dependent methyltransferase [Promicromonospora sp. AC04]|uniref:L-histidine N(alpha)-methyltransferase n=1 Tax=Promicromonospora sp. AC04 TaxID=2135723 RepID=UPI000D342D67|nr:L-histidine N(alpha)-methyltransferase [Promicromonospora sp. AC04]PUB28006.1 putative SAM-dependent methyltransferase [Promicromonospora sp. AC04]